MGASLFLWGADGAYFGGSRETAIVLSALPLCGCAKREFSLNNRSAAKYKTTFNHDAVRRLHLLFPEGAQQVQ